MSDSDAVWLHDEELAVVVAALGMARHLID